MTSLKGKQETASLRVQSAKGGLWQEERGGWHHQGDDHYHGRHYQGADVGDGGEDDD